MDVLLLLANLSLSVPPLEVPHIAQPAGISSCSSTFPELNAVLSLAYPDGQAVEVICIFPVTAYEAWQYLWEKVMPGVSDLSRVVYSNPYGFGSWFFVLAP